MVQQRRKAWGRHGRPKAGKTKRHAPRPSARIPPGGLPVGPHWRRVRDRPRRRSRGPQVVHPSERWRPMKRVAGVPWEEQNHGEPRRVRTDSPRHGRAGRLLEFEDKALAEGDPAATETGKPSSA